MGGREAVSLDHIINIRIVVLLLYPPTLQWHSLCARHCSQDLIKSRSVRQVLSPSTFYRRAYTNELTSLPLENAHSSSENLPGPPCPDRSLQKRLCKESLCGPDSSIVHIAPSSGPPAQSVSPGDCCSASRFQCFLLRAVGT